MGMDTHRCKVLLTVQCMGRLICEVIAHELQVFGSFDINEHRPYKIFW